MKLGLITKIKGIDAIHVNPSHIIAAYIDEDGEPCVKLDGFFTTWGQYTNEAYIRPLEYAIDMESYERVVAYLDAIERRQLMEEDARDLMRAVAEDDGERVSTGEVMDQLRNDDAVEQLVYALDECRRYACLCEYCPHKDVDFDTDPHDIPCSYDFDQLYKAAGMERPK